MSAIGGRLNRSNVRLKNRAECFNRRIASHQTGTNIVA